MILLGPLLTIFVCAAAFWTGGRPERCAASAIIIALAADAIGQALLGKGSLGSLIAADLLLGLAFTACAALHPRRWLYIEVGFAAALLLVHAFLLDGTAVMSFGYRAAVDAIDLLITGVLAWATWRHWSRRPDIAPARGGAG